jgi:hypothetical protein
MQRERSVQVDIETKSTDKNAFILAIGAVAFDDDGFLNAYEKTNPVAFYGQVPWDDPTQSDRAVSQDTLAWWAQQGEALQVLQRPLPHQAEWCYPGIVELLEGFAQFVQSQKTAGGRIVCKGVDFDVAILSQAMRHYNVPEPWKYNHTRCMRGWMDAAVAAGISPHLHMGIHGGNPGIKHHAADDAIWQTMIYVRYNHELWKIKHKSAQTGLFDAPVPTGAAQPEPHKTYTVQTGPAMMPAPTLRDAP